MTSYVKTSVALGGQRAVHCCIQTPTFWYADLALQFFDVRIRVPLHGLLLGLGRKSRKPRIPLLGPLTEVSALSHEESGETLFHTI